MDEDNEGIDAMDSMEDQLALMSLGESGYFVMVGAMSAGAAPAEGFNVMVAFFLAGMLGNARYNPTDTTEDEPDDDTTD